ncbi:hypothetical protein BST11_10155 [Mycobacterium alsense]|uniref:Low molecular weight antigen MTB12-like C-terminal domain-containing protein n=1 Tax=Mycobacterium alsense TaxID=324058 RepID=A0ABX3RAI8_9MYCO|nr:hypothetical protein [Mycobacterium alsense]OQZ90974.1 hypothetical protein BST11_10155 [Mycobacterium alsense]
MRLAPSVALAAATAGAVALAGCSHTGPKVVSSPSSAAPVPSTPVVVAAPPTAPLPAPEALIDVLNRLADPNVPGIDKVNLVEGATPDNAGTLDKFTKALRDNGYLPMTFAMKDVAWSDKNPSHVTATVTVNTAQANNGAFTFPMEFTPFASSPGGWQLSRRTAEMLLALGNSATSSTPPSPAPAPPPPPASPPAPPPPG